MNVANPSYYLGVAGGSKIYMKTETDIQIGTKRTGRNGFALFYRSFQPKTLFLL